MPFTSVHSVNWNWNWNWKIKTEITLPFTQNYPNQSTRVETSGCSFFETWCSLDLDLRLSHIWCTMQIELCSVYNHCQMSYLKKLRKTIVAHSWAPWVSPHRKHKVHWVKFFQKGGSIWDTGRVGGTATVSAIFAIFGVKTNRKFGEIRSGFDDVTHDVTDDVRVAAENCRRSRSRAVRAWRWTGRTRRSEWRGTWSSTAAAGAARPASATETGPRPPAGRRYPIPDPRRRRRGLSAASQWPAGRVGTAAERRRRCSWNRVPLSALTSTISSPQSAFHPGQLYTHSHYLTYCK